ncbi:Asp-tRNA(Asn)/Glu-tRNA(Gln) amidotransferase subunit GatA [Desulfohalovibrio reitneri]|uniref:Asp-tRNA(Asn)/Glu-tRNA(Gln) amidotransferase subunit GatA n=1 Tax=Desulfohalovibrio reitneri TaxID=1307759 RepID=UPI0004A6D0B5|nr:Asp-tRNA(Asn)/Glu-tRNA(Gln) amidotransferase subunit GatA [Desulfohalovibrio reitneri]
MSRLIHQPVSQLHDSLAAGDVTAEDATRACLERISATEPTLDALLTVDEDGALNAARELDASGYDPDKPLWGVPVVVKDVLCTKGLRTTCGSRFLENFVPPFDATAVAKLRQAGAVILGKANMDEFAMGSSTENSAYKTTANPWDTGRVPGGSSGGSGATVAAGQCFAALGTDTGGSIRLPASFCGTVGVKPTYGRVSRYGMVAFGSSLDQIGPLTRCVEDAARVLAAISGPDERDSTSAPNVQPIDPARCRRDDLKGVRIGLPKQYWGEGADDEVAETCRKAVDAARELGATTVELDLPLTDYAIATYYIVAMAEASSNLARFDGVRYGLRDEQARELTELYLRSRSSGFGDEVQRRILIGTYVLSSGYYDAYYRKAAQVRRLIRDNFRKAFERCDLIAGPTCPTTAFPIGGIQDPLKMYLMDIYTISCNLAGLPGMSLPAGLGSESGLPIGLQLQAPAFAEESMLAAAHALESALGRLPAPELG